MRTILLAAAMATAAAAQPSSSSLAAGILDQTDQARQAVASFNRDAALDHVKRALATVDEIQRMSPNAGTPLLVPVSREVETTTTITPVHHHDATELKHNSSIRGVEEQSTTTRLNVSEAASRLQAAQAALESWDWNAAGAALDAVRNGVTTAYSQGANPLDMARSNLDLARMRIQDGKFKDAEVPLRSAAQALGDYERQCVGQKAADVESARQAMQSYSSKVNHDRDSAAERIDAWRRMLAEWR